MIRKVLITLFSGLLFVGCTDQTTSVVPNSSRQGVVTDNGIAARRIGTGTGDLTIDGKALRILPGELIIITPGRYSSMTVSNLNGWPGLPIRLAATELVEIVGGELTLENVSYLIMDGGLATRNFLLRDNSYRGISFSGAVPHAITLQGIRARNISDYTIYYGNKTNYNQTDATAFTDFKLLYCDFENCGTIQFSGELNRSSGLVNTGFMKNPEIGYCSFRNSPDAGDLVYLGNAENVSIHNNLVNNVNTSNNNHNGIFHLRGNGSVHHNICTNHQGNFVRFWPVSQGIFPKDVLIHDNIVWNSRKYSAFELQSFSENMVLGISTYSNAKVYNNTVGRLNTTLPTVFVGVVVDVYNLFGGSVQILNNLSFELAKSSPNDGIWSQQSSTQPSVYTNNRNFKTADEAGLTDHNSFRLLPTSPAKAAGVYRLFLADDFYYNKRSLTPSIGAVE